MSAIEINQNVKFRPGLRPEWLDHLPEWGTVETIAYVDQAVGHRAEVSFYVGDTGEMKTIIVPAHWLDNGMKEEA